MIGRTVNVIRSKKLKIVFGSLISFLVLSTCATIGDSAVVSFSKDTGCPKDSAQYKAHNDSVNLYTVKGCGKVADYVCHNQNEHPDSEPKIVMASTPSNPVVCTKAATSLKN